jgi:hypothetical protein
MNRRYIFLFLITILFISGCATIQETRPGEVQDYDSFTKAFSFAFTKNNTIDGQFLKENYTSFYTTMREKLILILSNPQVTAVEREAATELFYWAESLGRIKEYKEIK